jgi:hypothetical protein
MKLDITNGMPGQLGSIPIISSPHAMETVYRFPKSLTIRRRTKMSDSQTTDPRLDTATSDSKTSLLLDVQEDCIKWRSMANQLAAALKLLNGACLLATSEEHKDLDLIDGGLMDAAGCALGAYEEYSND